MLAVIVADWFKQIIEWEEIIEIIGNGKTVIVLVTMLLQPEAVLVPITE